MKTKRKENEERLRTWLKKQKEKPKIEKK